MVEYRSDMILWILKENYSGCWETNKPWCGKIKRRLVKKKRQISLVTVMVMQVRGDVGLYLGGNGRDGEKWL